MHSTHPTMTTANQRDRRDHHPQKISGQENKRVTLPPIRDVFPGTPVTTHSLEFGLLSSRTDLFANTHHHSNDVRVIVSIERLFEPRLCSLSMFRDPLRAPRTRPCVSLPLTRARRRQPRLAATLRHPTAPQTNPRWTTRATRGPLRTN